MLAIVLLLITLAVRIPVALEQKIMPVGDAFNFQKIADAITHGTYPPHENRLPGYPLLLLLTRPLPVDPIIAGVTISVAAAALTLACFYTIGRSLRLHPAALLIFLGLAAFDPILIIHSIRPLSDPVFLLFVALTVLLIMRRSNPWLIGIAVTGMLFTRYEGFMVAAFLFPYVWYQLGWRKLIQASTIPLIAVLIWIPVYFTIHGTLGGGYIAELSKPGNSFGGLVDAPVKLMALFQGAGWGNAWTAPVFTPTWWISLLAVLGAVWLPIRERAKSLPIFLAIAGYCAVLMWWLVYSRFLAPLVPFYYLTAAGGASFLLTKFGRKYSVMFLIISFCLMFLIWREAPRLHKQGLGRAWENNQKGYAELQAIRQTAASKQKTAYWTEENAVATFYFKDHGFYLSQYPDESPEQLASILQETNVQYLINTGQDARLKQVIDILRRNNTITNTTLHRYPVWADNSWEEVPVYENSWHQ